MLRDSDRRRRGVRSLIVCGALCALLAASGPQVVAASSRASDSGAPAALTATPPTYQSAIFNAGGVPPLTPNDTALSADGNTLYASDEEGTQIVKVDQTIPPPNVTTVSPASNGWSHPSGLYLEPDQVHMLVADKDNNRIVEIDTTTGAFTRTWGGAGTPNPTEFNAPEDMTMDGAGNIYVNDTYHFQVIGLSASTGQMLWPPVTRATGPGPGCDNTLLQRNRGITIGSDGNLYVALTDRGQIMALDPATGSCLRVFGQRGRALGSFSEPRGIWADGGGGLWVAENGDARIQHVQLNGTPIWASPTKFGSGALNFRSPHGLQFVPGASGTGTIYVSDTYNYRIAIYTQNADGSATFSSNIQEPLPAAGGFDAPFGVAYDASGNLFVVDHYNSRAEEFDSNGAFVGQVGGAGVPPGSMNFPRGILVIPSTSPKWANDIMVCDSENHRMQVFKPTSFTATGLGAVPVGRLTPAGTSFLRPQQIAISPVDGSLWVADTNHHRILDVSLTGTVLQNWTASGNPRPAGIIVDSNNHVYVTGTNITEYTTTGGFVRTLATTGSAGGSVRLPDGMAIDSTGTTLYVADTNNNRVDEFDLTATTGGGFIQSFGTPGTGDGQFTQPYMVAVSATGQIAVSDFGNNRVSIWHA
jgi:DNA-binding beta-propeller fold protein YncE